MNAKRILLYTAVGLESELTRLYHPHFALVNFVR